MRPYFYVIEHIRTGRRYAGARWEEGCDPSEFMVEGGYITSSSTVHTIIQDEGIGAFKVLEIKEMDNPYSYETEFLHQHQCAESEVWLNKHNNDGRPPPYGSDGFKQLMLEIYGVAHNTHIPEVRERMTAKQKEFYKNNPDKTAERARKIAEAKKKNGTTGKGSKRPHYSNNGSTGTWARTDDDRRRLSEHQKQHSVFATNNPMNDPEKRILVSLSKVGKRKYMNPSTNEVKMFLPGTELDGFILFKKS